MNKFFKIFISLLFVVFLDCHNDVSEKGDDYVNDLDAESVEEKNENLEIANEVDTEKAIPPLVYGPPSSLFDCTASLNELPMRLSSVPPDCVINPLCKDRMIVAHRGAGGDFGIIAPENSLAAIRAAIFMGVDGVEIDVRVTKDGHVVLMHDEKVDRTTVSSGHVEDMTLEEITSLHFKTDAYKGDFSCETVPTFASVLSLCKGRLFIDVDTKTDKSDLVALEIKKADMLTSAFVSADSFKKILKAKEAVPQVRIQVRPDTSEEVEAAFSTFVTVPDIFEIPVTIALNVEKKIHEAGSKTFADVFFADPFVYYTDDYSAYLEVYNQGIDILQTEFPPLLLKALGRWTY